MSTVTSDEESDEDLESLKFNLNIESLGLVLYSSDPKLVSHMKNENLVEMNENGGWFRIS